MRAEHTGGIGVRTGSRGRRRPRLALLVSLAVAGASAASLAGAADGDGWGKFSPEAAATFNRRCTACHTYGKGVRVGPDLKGVTKRRTRDWLVKFVNASSVMIQSGDPIATRLFARFNRIRMPDWTDLTPKAINAIMDYLEIGGPDIKSPDERNADTATASEVDLGRRLFYGAAPFARGAQPCTACHRTGESSWLAGGSLGPDLGGAYFRFEDRALTSFLRRPCFRWASDTGERYLTPDESFALKAFLRQAALSRAQACAPPAGAVAGQGIRN